MQSEEKKFKEHVIMATNAASQDLMNEKGSLIPMIRKTESIFPGDKLQLEFFRPTVSQKYTKDEIREIIRKA